MNHQNRTVRTFRLGTCTLVAAVLGQAILQAQDLNTLVNELLERNPSILAAGRAMEAKRALIIPARTLPEPTVSFETMGGLIPPILMAGDPSSARVLRSLRKSLSPGN